MSVDVDTRVRRANPLARTEHIDQLYGEDVSRRLRSVIYAKTEGRMTDTNQHQKPAESQLISGPEPSGGPLTSRPRQRFGPIVALASFAIVIVVGVVIALVMRDGDAPDVAESPDTAESPAVETPADAPDSLSPEAIGERFIDTFLTLDPEAVTALAQPNTPLDAVHYLQGWAEAANYTVLVRQACTAEGSGVTCILEGRDDWSDVLGIRFTDIFRIQAIYEGKILGLSWTPEYDPQADVDAFVDWVFEQHAELFEQGGACDGMWSNGPTPGDCARAFVAAAEEYTQTVGS